MSGFPCCICCRCLLGRTVGQTLWFIMSNIVEICWVVLFLSSSYDVRYGCSLLLHLHSSSASLIAYFKLNRFCMWEWLGKYWSISTQSGFWKPCMVNALEIVCQVFLPVFAADVFLVGQPLWFTMSSIVEISFVVLFLSSSYDVLHGCSLLLHFIVHPLAW
jgi:hypothetical protein